MCVRSFEAKKTGNTPCATCNMDRSDDNASSDAIWQVLNASTKEEFMDALRGWMAELESGAEALDAFYLFSSRAGTSMSHKAVKKFVHNKKLVSSSSSSFDKGRIVEKERMEGVLFADAASHRKYKVPHSEETTEGDMLAFYGLPEALFNRVFKAVWKVVAKYRYKKRVRKRLRHSLYMTLYWLRRNPTFQHLEAIFGIRQGQAYRTIRRTLIFLRVALDSLIPKSVQWRKNKHIKKLVNFYGEEVKALGNLDGTAMYRRIKHGEDSWLLFRGDRDRPALTTQILSDFSGKVVDVVVSSGRNGDGSILSFSGTKQELEKLGLAVVVDSGYEADRFIITPESGQRKEGMTTTYNDAHGNVRSSVEQVNSWIKNWRAVTACRASIRMQATSIIVACCLYNLWRTEYPVDMSVWTDGTNLEPMTRVGPKVVRGVDAEERLRIIEAQWEAIEQLAAMKGVGGDGGGRN